MRKICILLFLAVLLLSGCCMSHEWYAATCAAPKTCARCGKTEGAPVEHVWQDATCEAPRTCTACGVTEGETLDHTWQEATCASPRTCTTCGTTEGDSIAHDYQITGFYDLAPESDMITNLMMVKICNICNTEVTEQVENHVSFVADLVSGKWVLKDGSYMDFRVESNMYRVEVYFSDTNKTETMKWGYMEHTVQTQGDANIAVLVFRDIKKTMPGGISGADIDRFWIYNRDREMFLWYTRENSRGA